MEIQIQGVISGSGWHGIHNGMRVTPAGMLLQRAMGDMVASFLELTTSYEPRTV